MQASAIQGILKQVQDIISKNISLKEHDVFLFGSWATGKARENSDIDIGIEGHQAVPAATLQKIRQEIEEIRTVRTIDVVDFKQADASFRQTALKSRKILNG